MQRPLGQGPDWPLGGGGRRGELLGNSIGVSTLQGRGIRDRRLGLQLSRIRGRPLGCRLARGGG